MPQGESTGPICGILNTQHKTFVVQGAYNVGKTTNRT
jgi:hypothetical protein